MGNTFKPSPNTFKKHFLCFKEGISAIEGLTVQFESKAGSRYTKSECIACPIIGDD
jgi:hypothetical protein